MRTSTAGMLSLGLVILAQSAGASAQQMGDVPRGLSASATLLGIYEDNIFRTPDGFGGDKKSGFRIVPSVVARYDLPVAGQGFYVDGGAGYNFYTRESSFNRGWWNVGAGVNWRLGSRCNGLLDASYSESQSDFSDLGIAVDNLEKERSYSVSASCAGPAGIGIVAGANYSKTNNSYFARELGNLRTYGYNAGLLYRSILVGDVTLQYMHEDRKYPNRLILTPFGIERDGLKVDRVALGVTRPIGARLTGSAGVSYIWTNPDVSVYDNFKGMGWNAALDYIISPKLGVGINASRDVTSSAAIDSSYQISRSYGAYGSYKLGSRTTLQVGASQMKRQFRGQYNNPLYPFLLPPRIRETTWHYYAGATYAPTDRWSLSLRYQHDDRNSAGSIYDYSGNSVSLSATINY